MKCCYILSLGARNETQNLCKPDQHTIADLHPQPRCCVIKERKLGKFDRVKAQGLELKNLEMVREEVLAGAIPLPTAAVHAPIFHMLSAHANNFSL